MRRLPYILLLIVVSMAVLACRRTPSYVIGKEDMARLLADMHIAESVVDMNHMEFNSDSARLLLRQSILANHGITQQQFDTSLVWYGHNIDKYLDVYERTVDILDKRNRDLGNQIIQTSVSMSGDSVDVWPAAKYVTLNPRLPSRLVSFDIDSDENWEKGDVYTWRIKLIDDNARSVRWTMLATYTDSTYEWLNASTSSPEWNEVIFASDSTKTLSNIKGYFDVLTRETRLDENDTKKESQDFWVDSISLVRKRANPDFYLQRHRIREYKML